GERFAIELLRYLGLEAPGGDTFDFVCDAHDFGETTLLRVGRRAGASFRRNRAHRKRSRRCRPRALPGPGSAAIRSRSVR
ncbi:hypothetical protein DBL03_26060, partial [Pseudomonas putida]